MRYFLHHTQKEIKETCSHKATTNIAMSHPVPPPLPSLSPPPPLFHPKPPPIISLPQFQVQIQESPTITTTTTTNINKSRSKINQLCKKGHLHIARQLFDSLPSPIPTLLYNTLLIGYVCNSKPLQALQLYSQMNQTHQFSDHYTYYCTLKACADAQQLNLGKSIHCHIIRTSAKLPKNVVLNNSLLNMYASGRDDVARLVFDRMPKRNVVSWNIMIAWYVKRQCFYDALRHFRRMVEVGIWPTSVSFVNVFPAVAGVKSVKLADLIYGMAVKCGIGDVFVVSLAMFMYAELFDIGKARWVFDLAKERNVEVWNTMIGGYAQNEEYEQAVQLFVNVLGSDEVEADSVTYLNSLMAVSQMQDVNLGKQIHGYLIKESVNKSLPLILCNALIVMYSRCGCVQLAFDLFQQMHGRDIVTWNTMISAFVQKELNLEGLLLVYEMQKQGFVVDPVTGSALLSAASNLGNLKIGKETHGYLIRHAIKCEGMESYLIDMYSKSGCVDIARKLFDVNRAEDRDQVTWNAMISGYVHNGQTEEALYLFRDMINEENQLPNSVTLSSILPACDAIGGVQAGKEIHAFAIRQLVDNNVFVGTALVDMYSRCGEILFAERVFDGMDEKNTVTYTTMISGFGQHGLGERALSLFQAMQKSGIKPDAITFVALLSACSYSGLVNEGLDLYESMSKYGIVTSPELSCCIVDMLGRAGRVEEAFEFVQGLTDDNSTILVWGALLAACRVHQKFELVKLVSDRMFEMEMRSDLAGYHVLLSNVYAAEGKWVDANSVRKEMRERGLRKEPGLSWIDVGDASHKFMSRDNKHPENDQIYEMLDELGARMRLSGLKYGDSSPFQGVSDLES